MQFDIRTLLIAASLATGVCAAARILLCRAHPSMPGLVHWAWASVLAAIALVLVAGYWSVPHALPIAQAFIAAGMVVAWQGFRHFVGRPALSRPLLAVLAFAVLPPIVIAEIEQSLAMLVTSNAVVVAVVSALIARNVLQAASPRRLAMRATGWLYAVNAALFVLRAVAVFGQKTPLDQMVSSGPTAFVLLWWLCMTMAVTLGMVLMTSERLQEDLDDQANRDPLTGALNRRAFSLIAEKEAVHARRNARPLSVLMMDLDHFKQINDHLGHAGGDAMLCRFASVAAKVLRSDDSFCRFGGEEFLALLPDSTGGQALAVAERLRAAYAEASTAEPRPEKALPVVSTVSIGVAEMGGDEDLDDVIRRADLALYRAKSAGRNRSELADSEPALAVGAC